MSRDAAALVLTGVGVVTAIVGAFAFASWLGLLVTGLLLFVLGVLLGLGQTGPPPPGSF